MTKNNQPFYFNDILDLDTILNTNSDKDQNEASVSNRYHLLSILMHRGTTEYGHNFAFIRPNISDNRWFNFNDSTVTEVTKMYALDQGIGGDFSHYEYLPNVYCGKGQPSASLNLKYVENNTNAYMLIYIR